MFQSLFGCNGLALPNAKLLTSTNIKHLLAHLIRHNIIMDIKFIKYNIPTGFNEFPRQLKFKNNREIHKITVFILLQ